MAGLSGPANPGSESLMPHCDAQLKDGAWQIGCWCGEVHDPDWNIGPAVEIARVPDEIAWPACVVGFRGFMPVTERRSLISFVLCRVLARHRYRNRVPQVFNCEVYCFRCGRVFGSFDAPLARKLWADDPVARRRMTTDQEFKQSPAMEASGV